MVYCAKCGQQNPEEARFCSSCGASLVEIKRDYGKEWEKRCEEDCARGPRGASVFWGVIITLIGLWILFEFGIKNISGLPQWVYHFEFWWVFALIIGLAVIIVGLRIIFKKARPQ